MRVDYFLLAYNFFRSLGATIEVDVAMLFLSDFAGHFSSMGT